MSRIVIEIPSSPEEVLAEQVIQLGNRKTTKGKCNYLLKDICKLSKDKIDKLSDLDKEAVLATFNYKLSDKLKITKPKDIKIDGVKLKLLKDPLDMKVQTFVELVNIPISEDSFIGIDVMTACFFREDFSKPYSEKELYHIAEMLYKKPLTYSLWGVKLYENLINLLKSTFPILYEGGNKSEESEGRRAYDMLNSLAKDEPTKWEEAQNLTLKTAFLWMEQKAIEADKRKRQV